MLTSKAGSSCNDLVAWLAAQPAVGAIVGIGHHLAHAMQHSEPAQVDHARRNELRRYGFHGLCFAYLMADLACVAGAAMAYFHDQTKKWINADAAAPDGLDTPVFGSSRGECAAAVHANRTDDRLMIARLVLRQPPAGVHMKGLP